MSYFSFAEVFEKAIPVCEKADGASEEAVISRMVIPKIQRPYAQGRTDKVATGVRNQFLNDLFQALTSGQVLELNFVYGNIIRTDGDNFVMELLDGQQRMTTLFLLHWYLCVREQVEDETRERIKNCLKKFVYETRATTSAFCSTLAEYFPFISDDVKPSDHIRNSIWYHHSFECDSSVTGMLEMLDAIHEKYCQCAVEGSVKLHEYLDNLRFYIASIGEFTMKEDLYIKMNARGLQLSAFENFKADYANLLKDKADAPKHFMERIDTRWVDIFWNEAHHEDFDSAYFKFISRFLAALYVAEGSEPLRKDGQKDERLEQLYTLTNKEDGGRFYAGFEPYKELLEKHTSFLEFVFETFHSADNRALIEREFVPAWERDDAKPQQLLDDATRNTMSQPQFVQFAALLFFLLNIWENKFCGELPEEGLKRWMRMVHNIVRNTDVTDIEVAGRLIRKLFTFANVLNFSEPESIYADFAAVEDADRAVAVREEQEKAAAIAKNSEWESVLLRAEKDPFMEGDVHCIFSPGMTPATFLRRYEFSRDIFDAKGITEAYRGAEHLLVRAIVSDYRTWAELVNNFYITEIRKSTNSHLKNNLKRPKTKELLAAVLDTSNREAALDYLRQHIAAAKDKPCNSEGYCFAESDFRRGLENLRTCTKLYDYIYESDSWSSKGMRIYDYYGNGFVVSRYNSQQRIYLDTDRGTVAQSLEKELGYEFSYAWQKQQIEECGLCFGDELKLTKSLEGGYSLDLHFRTKQQICLEMTVPDEGKRYLLTSEIKHTSYTDTYEPLKQWLTKIETQLIEGGINAVPQIDSAEVSAI